jgi:hypothetical protein
MHSTFPLSRLREYVGWFLFLALVSSAVWFTRSQTRTVDAAAPVSTPTRAPKNKPTPRCPQCAPAGDQEIYVPLIDIPEAAGGQIVFNSRSPHAMDVTPVFYKRGGEKIMGDPVTVQSAEIRYVDIKDLLPQQHRSENDWGGFSLIYYGFNREMWSQFRFIGVNGGTNVDEFFTVKSESRADDFEATWWMPENSEAVIGLGNITDVTTSVTVSFGADGVRMIEIPPHGTEVLRHKSEKGVSASSAVINVTGAPGSIVPTGLITSKDGTFNSVIRFYSPKVAKQANLYANGFRVTGNTPHMVLRNTTANSIAVVPTFTPLAGAAASPFVLSQVSLAAFEAKEVDLADLLRAAKYRNDLDVVSVEVTNLAAAGSIIGSLYAINDRTGMNYDIPLRDSGLVRTMTGSYPWKINDDFTTIVYITNISDQDAKFVGEINYSGTHFLIDPQTVRGGETAVFDLKRIRDSQTADRLGTKLPNDVSIGQFKWAILSSTKGKVVLIGRAEMVSESGQVSSSYSCNDPCPPQYSYWIDPLEPYIVVGESGTSAAWCYVYYGSGYTMGPYSASGSWTIDNSAAASIESDSANYATVTGDNADVGGDVTLSADLGRVDTYSWDGLNCYYGSSYEDIEEQTTKIAGISNAVMVEGREYEDGTADFYTISPCNVMCKASGFVRIRLGCQGTSLQYEFRTEYWVRNEPFGPTACLGGLIAPKYDGTCHPIDCFETILAP